MPRVKVDLENLPEGAMVEIPYLGAFQNGTTTDVDEAAWDRWLKFAPGSDTHLEDDTLEVSTSRAQEVSDAVQDLRAAARAAQGGSLPTPPPVSRVGQGGGQGGGQSEPQSGPGEIVPLDKRSKDELIQLAEAVGHDTTGKNKNELIELLSQEG